MHCCIVAQHWAPVRTENSCYLMTLQARKGDCACDTCHKGRETSPLTISL